MAVCPGEFGGGLWVLGPCLLITVDGRAGAGSQGLFPGVPRVLRWRKISKPVKAYTFVLRSFGFVRCCVMKSV